MNASDFQVDPAADGVTTGKKRLTPPKRRLLAFVAFMVGAMTHLSGCGDSQRYVTSISYEKSTDLQSSIPGAFDRQATASLPMMRDQASGMMGRIAGGPNVAEPVLQDIPGGAVAKPAGFDRKIIYTATLDLITEDLDTLEPKLIAMIGDAGGFVAETNQTGAAGGQRSATWRVRVPVDRYDGFLQKARTLGEVQSVQVQSQDVTEEFVDVSARVAAKKVQEERLIDLIKNATAKLEDVLKVEAELARVRSDIERMEGRIRFLKDQTELTTITISVREVKDYKPPEAPTFATRSRRAWTDSTDLLRRNVENFAIAFVAWAPFIPLYVVGCGAGLWLLWRVWRKIRPMLVAAMARPIVPTSLPDTPKRTDTDTEPPDAP